VPSVLRTASRCPASAGGSTELLSCPPLWRHQQCRRLRAGRTVSGPSPRLKAAAAVASWVCTSLGVLVDYLSLQATLCRRHSCQRDMEAARSRSCRLYFWGCRRALERALGRAWSKAAVDGPPRPRQWAAIFRDGDEEKSMLCWRSFTREFPLGPQAAGATGSSSPRPPIGPVNKQHVGSWSSLIQSPIPTSKL
jgi:hypothetical protein